MKSIFTDSDLEECWEQGRRYAQTGKTAEGFSIGNFKSVIHVQAFKRGMHSVNFKFPKAIVLVGPAGSGKSALAQSFASIIGDDDVRLISGDSFFDEIEGIKRMTLLVIVDEVTDDFKWRFVIDYLEKVKTDPSKYDTRDMYNIPPLLARPGYIFLCQSKPNLAKELEPFFTVQHLKSK